MTIETVSAFILQIIAAAGGSVLIVLAFIKYFGASLWNHALKQKLETFKAEEAQKLESIRAEGNLKLEQYKHSQSTEVASLAVRLDAALAGGLKIQEKEFEVYPKLWMLLDEVHGRYKQVSSPASMGPPISDMSDLQLEELFAKLTWLEDTQKQAMRDQTSLDRAKLFFNYDANHRVAKAQSKLAEFETFFVHNKVFFKEPLKSHVVAMNAAFWNVNGSLTMWLRADQGSFQTQAGETLRDVVEPLYAKVEEEITNHLRAMSISTQ